MDMQTEDLNEEALEAERLSDLKTRAHWVDSVAQLGQAKALASLISSLCETPNRIDPEMIGWVGSLMSDTLARLELAIEIERLNHVRDAIEAEVTHG